MMQKRPADRYTNMRDVELALADYLQNEPIAANAEGTAKPKTWFLATAAVLALALACSFGPGRLWAWAQFQLGFFFHEVGFL